MKNKEIKIMKKRILVVKPSKFGRGALLHSFILLFKRYLSQNNFRKLKTFYQKATTGEFRRKS